MKICSIKIILTTIFISILVNFFLNSHSLGSEINDTYTTGENDTLYLSISEALLHASMGSLSGVMLGGALGVGTAYLLFLKSSKNEPIGIGLGIGAIIGASIGSPIGSTTYLYLESGKNCSFLPMLAVSILPVAVLYAIEISSGKFIDSPPSYIIGWILAPIGATIYYEFSKRNNNLNQSSLIEVKRSQINFSFPELNINYNSMPYFSPNSKSGYSEYQINLISIEF